MRKIKLTKKSLEGLLQRLRDEPSLTPEERRLLKEAVEEAIRTGHLKVKK